MKNKKTVFRWILPLFLAIALCITIQDMAASAAEAGETEGTEEQESCSHDWVWTSTKPATCEQTGGYIYTCKNCGETKIVEIPKKTMIWVFSKIIKPATCHSTGIMEYKCPNCGQTKTEVIPINEDAHKWQNEVTKKPTLTEKGTYTTSCKVCGKEEAKYNLLLGKTIPRKYCARYVKVYSKTSAKDADSIGWVKINSDVYVFEEEEFNNNFTFRKICYPVGTTNTAYILNNQVSIQTDAGRAPDKIKSFKLIPGKNKITVSWKKDSFASGYQLTYASNKQFTKGAHSINIKNNKTVKKIIKNLKSKERYFAGVRGYRKVKGKIIYGPYSMIRGGRVR